jgi:NDP-sugar pyrophosphorylase family protein
MDAMIFAAGLGTRLRPLTHDRPKALVEVGGVPILEIVARRLVAAGADRIIINTHHFAERVHDFVRQRDGFGADVRFSDEPNGPLDTGGGLARAAHLFRREGPILLHNCDVLSDLDLGALVRAHHDDAIATLAVLPGATERYLIFDDEGLCGFAPRGGGDDVLRRQPHGPTRGHDFTGIHVVASRLLDTLEQGTYSIINHYLALAAQGERIAAWLQPELRWLDIGSHEKLRIANDRFRTS